MADPTVGSVFLIKARISVGPDVYATIADVTSYDRSTTRSTGRTRVFGRLTPHAGSGSREEGYTITALLNPTDPGQAALLAAEAADTAIPVQIFSDGTVNGFKQDVKITSKRHGARADDDFQEITYELAAAADATVVGTGIII